MRSLCRVPEVTLKLEVIPFQLLRRDIVQRWTMFWNLFGCDGCGLRTTLRVEPFGKVFCVSATED